MKKLSKRLLKAQGRLREIVSVYVPEAADYEKESDAWFAAMMRDERAADALRLDFAS